MPNNNLRDFYSFLSRNRLLKKLDNVNKLTPELKNYIINDMSYDNALLYAFGKYNLLKEETTDKQIEQAKKREAIERKINQYLDIPIAYLFGLNTTSVTKTSYIPRNLLGDNYEEMIEVGTSWLARKIIIYKYDKLNRFCKERHEKDKEGFNKCVIAANEKMIKELKEEYSKCEKVPNVEGCRIKIANTIDHYMEKIRKLKKQKF